MTLRSTSSTTSEIILQHNTNGVPVRQEPIVLTVPFTTNWEYTIRAEADVILANGHRLAVPLLWSEMEPRLKALARGWAAPNGRRLSVSGHVVIDRRNRFRNSRGRS